MSKYKMNKIQLCLVTFGVIIGIVGILHGSAELLKGSILVEQRRASPGARVVTSALAVLAAGLLLVPLAVVTA